MILICIVSTFLSYKYPVYQIKLSWQQESLCYIIIVGCDIQSIVICKPCSVPLYCKRIAPCTQVVTICLQKHKVSVPLIVKFLREGAPTIIWVSRSRGLPRSTLTISCKTTSLWHFQGINTISKRLRCVPCR